MNNFMLLNILNAFDELAHYKSCFILVKSTSDFHQTGKIEAICVLLNQVHLIRCLDCLIVFNCVVALHHTMYIYFFKHVLHVFFIEFLSFEDFTGINCLRLVNSWSYYFFAIFVLACRRHQVGSELSFDYCTKLPLSDLFIVKYDVPINFANFGGSFLLLLCCCRWEFSCLSTRWGSLLVLLDLLYTIYHFEWNREDLFNLKTNKFCKFEIRAWNYGDKTGVKLH